MVKIREYLRLHRPAVVLAVVVLALTFVPLLEVFFFVGSAWRGIPPTFSDDLYFTRVHTIGEGHLTAGNPYFLEHSDGPPLVIFGGAWINAIPLWMGLSFITAQMINFIIWSLLFAASVYWLFRELRAPPWVAMFGTLFLYIQSYGHVWRPANLQPVFPFYFLFYIALLCLVRDQSRRNSVVLGLATGATFYLYAYLWQTAVVTLGLLFLYALVRKHWPLLKATLLSSLIGGVIGLPVPLYMLLWLPHISPYFWESMGRLGLVNTHLPMADVIYFGGWVGVALALLVVLYHRSQALREDKEFMFLNVFLCVSGLGLWIMQGSNFITGKLLETGEHVAGLIFPWLVFTTFGLGAFLWSRRAHLSQELRIFSVVVLVVLSVMNIRFINLSGYLTPAVDSKVWRDEQSFAGPLTWLQMNEKNPVVIWSDPHDHLATVLPIYTKDFVLYAYYGMLELVPEGEIRERYLISQYFNNPTVADLKSETEMGLYLGRHDYPHYAKTIERGIKICRILYFWDKNKDCGVPPTSQQLLGDKFFTDLENKFQNDIKPNIKAYFTKYHVSYILKDKVLNPKYHPETLGAKLVYSDDRYELWHVQ